MKLPKLFLLPALAGLVFSGGSALSSDKQLVLNDEVFCDMAQAMIDVSGDLRVTLADLEECVGTGEGLALSPLLAVPDSVPQGESFQAVWSSVGAEQCNLVVPTGWSSGTGGLSGATSVSVPESANPGDYELDVNCISGTDQVTSTATVSVTESDPDSPPSSPSLSSSVLDSTAPGEVRLTWTPSSGASDCEAESSPSVGEWSGSVGASGTNNQVTLSGLAAGNYTFRLRCSNDAGNSPWVQRTASISGSEACSDRQPPEGWTQFTNGCRYRPATGGWSGDCTNWNPGIWSAPFHQTIGVTERLAMAGRNGSGDRYLAIEIDTTGMPTTRSGRLNVFPDSTLFTRPETIVTISSCPGDFHREAVESETGCYGRHAAGMFANFRWGGTASGESCQLESGRTYYLNIIATSSPLGTHPDDLEPYPGCVDGSKPCGLVYDPQ